MNNPPLPIDETALSHQLAATPGLDLGPNGRLVPLPATADLRDPHALRHHFEWVCGNTPRYHLVAGPQVSIDFEKTKLFHSRFPDLAIRPIALLQIPGSSVAVLEHFDGQTLEFALSSNHLSIPDALSLLDRLIDRLDASIPFATPAEISEDLSLLREELFSSPVWGTLDLRFFDSTVFPFLQNAFSSLPLMRRWTNGDFIPRNLLVDANHHVRLIDFEFAAQSSLAAADYFRFGEFSTLPPEVNHHVTRRLPGDPRVWRIHFYLDQARKLARIRTFDSFAFDAETLLLRLLREFAPDSTRDSCLVRSRQEYDDLSLHARKLQHNYDELTAHSSSLQTQFDTLQTQFTELLARYNELLAHSNSLQGHYDALAQHTRNLQAAYNTLAHSPT